MDVDRSSYNPKYKSSKMYEGRLLHAMHISSLCLFLLYPRRLKARKDDRLKN